MAGVLTGTKPKDTYDSLLHVENNDNLTASFQYVVDGLGNYSTIEMSTLGTRITNTTLNGTLALGSPLALTYGGLGVSLSDPGADRILFWDDSAGSTSFLELGPNLSITGTTLDAIGGGVTDHGALSGLADDDHSQYHTDGRADTWLATKTTTNLTEGANLYYTAARFNTAFSGKTTTDLTEGTNLYYTNARADARIAAAAGVTIQNYDTTLSTLAALPTAADKLPYFTGVDTSALTDLTAFARTVLDDTDAATMRVTLGIGAVTGTNTGDQNIFQTISVSGQSDVVADTTTDTLTFVAGTNISITTDAATDTITFTNTMVGLSDADYGDITVSAAGTVMTIDNDVVTYAKMQNVSNTDKLLGRSSLGAGDVEEITCTSFGRSLIDDADASAGRTTLGVVIGTDVQAHDTTLDSLASYNTNGLLTQTTADTFTGRTITGTVNQITVTNGDGILGNPVLSFPATISLISKTILSGTFTYPIITALDSTFSFVNSDDVTKVMKLSCAGITTGTTRTLTVPDADGTIALTSDLTTYQPIDSTLTAVAAYNTNGLLTQTAADTFTGRTITGTANEVTITDGDGVAGNPTVSLPAALTFTGKTVTDGTFTTPTINVNDNVLSIRDNLDTTKITQFQCSGITTGTTRTLTIPDVSGTIALTADLSAYQPLDSTLTAVAAYNTNGLLTQTSADTFTGRTLTGTANQITITNGDGVAGNPTLSIPYNVSLGSSSTASSSIEFFEDTDNGSNKITVTVPSSIAADYTLILPGTAGTSGQVLQTDGSGTTTWAATSSGTVNLGLTSLIACGVFSG